MSWEKHERKGRQALHCAASLRGVQGVREGAFWVLFGLVSFGSFVLNPDGSNGAERGVGSAVWMGMLESFSGLYFTDASSESDGVAPCVELLDGFVRSDQHRKQ